MAPQTINGLNSPAQTTIRTQLLMIKRNNLLPVANDCWRQGLLLSAPLVVAFRITPLSSATHAVLASTKWAAFKVLPAGSGFCQNQPGWANVSAPNKNTARNNAHPVFAVFAKSKPRFISLGITYFFLAVQVASACPLQLASFTTARSVPEAEVSELNIPVTEMREETFAENLFSVTAVMGS